MATKEWSAKVKSELSIQVELNKRSLSLITKALCGKLRPEELEEAHSLGVAILQSFEEDLVAKAQAASHAIEKAIEGK